MGLIKTEFGGCFMRHNFDVRIKKKERVAFWLAKFGFSNRELLAELLNVSVKGQHLFFQSLINEGLVSEKFVSGTRKKILSLTKLGQEFVLLNNPELVIKKVKSFSLYTLVHSYSIQKFLLSQKGSDNFFTENELSDKKFHRRPDMIIVNEHGSKIAVEVELTRKSSDRIYHIYRSLSRDWSEGKFDYVIFLFSSPTVLGQYKELYEKNIWPEFKINADGGRKLTRDGSFDPSNVHSHGLIIFHQFEPYSL